MSFVLVATAGALPALQDVKANAPLQEREVSVMKVPFIDKGAPGGFDTPPNALTPPPGSFDGGARHERFTVSQAIPALLSSDVGALLSDLGALQSDLAKISKMKEFDMGGKGGGKFDMGGKGGGRFDMGGKGGGKFDKDASVGMGGKGGGRFGMGGKG